MVLVLVLLADEELYRTTYRAYNMVTRKIALATRDRVARDLDTANRCVKHILPKFLLDAVWLDNKFF